MSFNSVLAIGSEKFHELDALDVREARANTDVFQIPAVGVKAQQQRADRRLVTALVPTKSVDDAIAFALVLHLQHHSLVRLVGSVAGFRNHAIESCALEALEPISGR